MRLHAFVYLLVLVFSSLGFASSNYAHYDELLAKNWAIPNSSKSECDSFNPRLWMDKAQQIISVEPIKARYKLDQNEVMVIRNLLISQAYNRLFMYSLKEQNTTHPQVKFIWIAAGSQASVTVGHALQVGLADEYPRGSRQNEIFTRLENSYSKLPKISALLLKTIDKVKKKTAENNWRVYSDIYWQHLAYMTCGLREIVNLNKILMEEKRITGDFEAMDHYKRFINVWQDMANGRYLEANMKLIYIEQHNILQKYMYNGLDAQAANAMLLFNRMAKAELAGPGGREIMSFSTFSLKNFLYPNLSYFPTRYKWMQYVVREQALYLQELATLPKIENVLERSLKESYQVAHDYLGDSLMDAVLQNSYY